MRKPQIVVLAGFLAAMSSVAASAQLQLSDGEKPIEVMVVWLEDDE